MSQYGPPGGPYPGQPPEPWPAHRASDPYREPSDPWGGGQHDSWGGTPSSIPPDAVGSPTGYDEQRYGDPRYDQRYGDSGYGEQRYGDPGYGEQRYGDPGYGEQRYGDPGYGTGHPQTRNYEPPAPQPVATPMWSPPAPSRRKGPGAPIIALVTVLTVLVCGGLVFAVYLVGGPGPDDQAKGGSQPAVTRAGGPAAQEPTSQPETTRPAPQSSSDARFVKAGQCVRNDGSGDKPKMSIVTCAPKTYEVLARFDGATNGEADAKSKCSKVSGYTNWYFFNSELDVLDFVLCLKRR